MLRKLFRLKKDEDFRKVFKNSKPFYFGNLVLRSRGNSKLGQISRFGFVISNKIDKRATKRNELKRKMRSIISLATSKIKPGNDIVLVVTRNFNYPYDYSQIESEVINILKKANLLYD